LIPSPVGHAPHVLSVLIPSPVGHAPHVLSDLTPSVAEVQVKQVEAAEQVAQPPEPHVVQVPALEKNVGLHSVHVVMAAGHFRQLVES
tara:strand:- start:825 stop:1088 length:264 start_codon:yes stop_codon:yes gene_type:complete